MFIGCLPCLFVVDGVSAECALSASPVRSGALGELSALRSLEPHGNNILDAVILQIDQLEMLVNDGL